MADEIIRLPILPEAELALLQKGIAETSVGLVKAVTRKAELQIQLAKLKSLLSEARHLQINAMVETFFKTPTSELVWRTAFETRDDATAAIGRSIDGFYNPIRRHSALDFTSPAQFEKMADT